VLEKINRSRETGTGNKRRP